MPPDEQAIHFSFPQPKTSGRIVAEFQNVSKYYGEKKVFDKVNFVIERGDRVALVGVNGAGKSTLIKLLSGSEPLTEGEYRLGHNVSVDYFAQDQYKELDKDAKLLDDLTEAAPRRTQTELRSLLGCFLFSEDDVFKRIGVLSGGERNRYALAKMLLSPSNFILLDEPTNHLDMRAKDVLLESLEEYTGTVVLVSHDRYFIDKLATRVFEIGNGEVTVFPGNYEDYLWRKSGKPLDLPAGDLGLTLSDVPGHVPAGAAGEKTKRVNPMKIQKLKDRCTAIEGEIESTEAEIARLEGELGNFKSTEETLRISQTAEARRTALNGLLTEWEKLSQELEAAGSPVG
jgi:ATP-binding cassette subfamily F protein 3